MRLSVADLEALYEEIPHAVFSCPAQLSFHDRLVYYWLGRSFFTGFGSIVDAGALIGGSATLIGEGMRQNPCAAGLTKRILSYDLFEDVADGAMVQAIRAYADLVVPEAVNGRVDFEPMFRAQTAAYADLIDIRRGDICTRGYADELPIEALSFDVGKTPDLTLHVVREFMPRLVPGKSIVLNQDYLFAYQPWLHMAMELLDDCFVKEFDAPTGCTSIHRLTRPITKELVRERLGETGSDYFKLENVRCIDSARQKASSPHNKLILRAAMIHAYWMLGRRRTAQALARQCLDEHNLSIADVARIPPLARLFTQLGVPFEQM
ncbi:MAG: hypothetical protein K2P70_18570 [Hyphomonadaceae bacterium]|jgi:hypothetical protein|nr:hypothetical protein [Hyphomonadaceae bacterium]